MRRKPPAIAYKDSGKELDLKKFNIAHSVSSETEINRENQSRLIKRSCKRFNLA